MDRHQGEEDEERKRQRLEATKTRAARMRDNDPSESEEDETRPPSKKRKKRTTSSKKSEEEVVTLEGKLSALRKFLKGSTRSKKKVRSETAAPVARDERVGTPDPAWSTVGELPEEDNTSTSFHPRGLYIFFYRGGFGEGQGCFPPSMAPYIATYHAPVSLHEKLVTGINLVVFFAVLLVAFLGFRSYRYYRFVRESRAREALA